MAKRSTKKPSVNLNNEAVKTILVALLAEFKERRLGAEDLHNTYKGLAPAQLKTNCCTDNEVSEVDFDLAMQELGAGGLVKTGPMELYPNDPNSGIFIMMFFSKNEFSYLTTDGYKAAAQLQTAKPPRSAPSHVHITGNTFQSSQIGIGGSVTQSGDINTATPQQLFERTRTEITQHVPDDLRRKEILTKLDELQAAVDKPSKMERYNQFVGSLGDHITVLQFILPPLMYWLMN